MFAKGMIVLCREPRHPPNSIWIESILFGGIPDQQGRFTDSPTNVNVNCVVLTDAQPADLEKLWTIETGTEEFHKPSAVERKMVNDRVVEQFERDIRLSEEGYVIKLPWKTDGTKEELPDNRGIAVKRLHAILKKYKDSDLVMSKYQETIEDQLQKGVIEEVDPNNRRGGALFESPSCDHSSQADHEIASGI
ncbi:hypothetical protein L596_030527 [Steinernema carpocapsae]|uniref:Uncharacterized protein n=1 Tax=Steinernema carpocapsae TaxID=34508 RepID=A0A4U5LPN5_STECR|nr:hypothetical protein L596_030527 [Steinernema carpocapsae]